MERYKALLRYGELCDAIRAGAVLCKNNGGLDFFYSLRLTEEQAKSHGSSTATVGKQIGKKFSAQRMDVIECKIIKDGYNYEYKYR